MDFTNIADNCFAVRAGPCPGPAPAAGNLLRYKALRLPCRAVQASLVLSQQASTAAGVLRAAQPGDLLKMEGLVLQSLGFHINMPTAHTFLSLLKLGLRLDARAAAAASFITARKPS